MSEEENSNEEISNLFNRIGRLQYIIISLIISGFIVFGREFILLWAGDGYEKAYFITLIFFVSLLPAQTQQIGWIVCKARNHLKFRTYVYIVIAISCLIAQVLGSKYFGIMGNAIPIGFSLILMEGFILNVYYQRVEHIDIMKFWRNILKLSVIPVILVWLSFYLKQKVTFDSWPFLLLGMAVFGTAFVLLSFLFSFNKYEKNLFFRKK